MDGRQKQLQQVTSRRQAPWSGIMSSQLRGDENRRVEYYRLANCN